VSYLKYRNLVARSPDLGLDEAARKLKEGNHQILAWASRHVSEVAATDPGSRSTDLDASLRIGAETGR
jgi:hypothetical protein